MGWPSFSLYNTSITGCDFSDNIIENTIDQLWLQIWPNNITLITYYSYLYNLQENIMQRKKLDTLGNKLNVMKKDLNRTREDFDVTGVFLNITGIQIDMRK